MSTVAGQPVWADVARSLAEGAQCGSLELGPDSGALPAELVTLLGAGRVLGNVGVEEGRIVWRAAGCRATIELPGGKSLLLEELEISVDQPDPLRGPPRAALRATLDSLALRFEYLVGNPVARLYKDTASGWPLDPLISVLGIDAPRLPGGMGAALGELEVHGLELLLDVSEGGIPAARFSFAPPTERRWTIIEGLFDVHPVFSWHVEHPFDAAKRQGSIAINGHCVVGDTVFEVLAALDSGYFEARMATGSSLDVAGVLKTILPGVSFPSIEILDVDVSGNFATKTFELELSVGSDWDIDILGGRFSISDLEASAEYADGTVEECTLRGQVTLAGARFDVTADYGDDAGWHLQGRSTPETEISFRNAFTALCAETGLASALALDLPPDIDLTVGRLYFSYDTNSGRASFGAALAKPISLSAGLSLGAGFVHVEFGRAGLTRCALMSRLLLGSPGRPDAISIAIESAKDAGGWVFRGKVGDIGLARLVDAVSEALSATSQVPEPLRGARLREAMVSFNHVTGDFRLDATTELDGLLLELVFRWKRGKGIVLALRIAGREFVLQQDAVQDTHLLVARFRSDGGEPVSLRELSRAVWAQAEGYVPDLTLMLKEIGLVWARHDASSKFLFALHLDSDVDFSSLPLVGEVLGVGARVGVRDLQVLAATREFAGEELKALRGVPDATGFQLPEGNVQKGAAFAARLDLGPEFSERLTLPMPASTSAVDGAASAPAVRGAASPGGAVKWLPVGRSLGPVYVARVGVGLQGPKLRFLLSASLELGPLKVSLEGLGLDTPLDRFAPAPRLNGLGLKYEGGPVKVGGAFERTPSGGLASFLGTATLEGKAFTLTGIGSYAYDPKTRHTSVSVFALYDRPIGGPAFFFVTGVAAGFGYNSALALPETARVREFPLVRLALGEDRQGIAGELRKGRPERALGSLARELAGFTSHRPGALWVAAGVRFTSFRVIDSFALLTVAAGRESEINLLGLSRMRVPATGGRPVAYAELALKARFRPEQGELKVEGLLTPDSYILDRACRLTGGYAFYAWSQGAHAGDFVLTLGGYHPRFQRPAHYPVVPRVGFLWQVTRDLRISGEYYYALTPSCLMAGGRLSALYQRGRLRAWFEAYVDFLLVWEPLYYEAEIGLLVGASYRLGWGKLSKTVSAELGARLHLWGPPFAGEAHVKWTVISFTVRFGALGRRPFEPITWEELTARLLPGPSPVACTGGALAEYDHDSGVKCLVVNAHQLRFSIRSAVPSTAVEVTGIQARFTCGQDPGTVGVRPLRIDRLVAELEVKITTSDTRDPALPLRVSPIREGVPEALWSPAWVEPAHLSPGAKFIADVLTGVVLEAEPGEPGTVVECRPAAQCERVAHGRLSWKVPPGDLTGSFYDPGRVVGRIERQDGVQHERRRRLLEALDGIDPAADDAAWRDWLWRDIPVQCESGKWPQYPSD